MYDSDRKELIPREQWMVDSEGPESWEREEHLARDWEESFKYYVPILLSSTNQSGGIHVYQMMTGCDLRDDGSTTGFNQRRWDGQDFLNYDRSNNVWVTPVPWGESIKNRCNRDTVGNQRWKDYLEVECIEWLRKYLEYGQRELRV
ncbi:hypothetical protein scyTo_0026536, partial [Scyliorhinus torazame]|nr:hypothetical protein [Scyliorhinus torazame]